MLENTLFLEKAGKITKALDAPLASSSWGLCPQTPKLLLLSLVPMTLNRDVKAVEYFLLLLPSPYKVSRF